MTRQSNNLRLEAVFPEDTMRHFPQICINNREESCLTFSTVTIHAEKQGTAWSGGITVSAEFGNLADVDAGLEFARKDIGFLLSITSKNPSGFTVSDFVREITGDQISNYLGEAPADVEDLISVARLKQLSVEVSSQRLTPKKIEGSMDLFGISFDLLLKIENGQHLLVFYVTGADADDLSLNIGDLQLGDIVSDLITDDDLIAFSSASNNNIGSGIASIGARTFDEAIDFKQGFDLSMILDLNGGLKDFIGDVLDMETIIIRVKKQNTNYLLEAEAQGCNWSLYNGSPFTITEFTFYVRKEQTSTAFGFGAAIDIQNGPDFTGDIGIIVGPGGLKMEARIEYAGTTWWHEPFGIDDLKVNGFALDFAIPLTRIPIPSRFAVYGNACVMGGNSGDWCADISIFTDVEKPLYFFSGRFDALNMKQIANGLDKDNIIPNACKNALEDFGFSHLDFETAYAPLGAISPTTVQRHDGTQVSVDRSYFQANVEDLRLGIIRVDHGSFYFEKSTQGLGVEAAISMRPIHIRIPDLDWLDPSGQGLSITIRAPTTNGAVQLTNLGGSGCTNSQPCGKCEGDCDRDSHCAGNLVCFKRDSSSEAVPGCSSGGSGDIGNYDYCTEPTTPLRYLGMQGCTDSQPCGKCEGDCDRDSQCAGSLVCFQRDSSSVAVPGCATGGSGDIGNCDYCFEPPMPKLVNLGHSGCTGSQPCGKCEGDCDRDSDCAGNLVCFQRSSSSEAVPGCMGGWDGDIGNYDYCIEPEEIENSDNSVSGGPSFSLVAGRNRAFEMTFAGEIEFNVFGHKTEVSMEAWFTGSKLKARFSAKVMAVRLPPWFDDAHATISGWVDDAGNMFDSASQETGKFIGNVVSHTEVMVDSVGGHATNVGNNLGGHATNIGNSIGSVLGIGRRRNLGVRDPFGEIEIEWEGELKVNWLQ